MKELSDKHKLQIENELYTEVMLLIESQYNLEGIIDINKKDSTKIIFKDKKAAIQKVAKAIRRFSEENSLDVNAVKSQLLDIIENKINLKNIFEEEYKEAQGIIKTDIDEEER